MNYVNAAEVLCRYLEDKTFAEAVKANPAEATKSYGLSAEDMATLFATMLARSR